ncbi:hypothetical protein LB566_28445 [Mesorhizobium sp. CA13]|uniref:hypothetical protein n=1 Tax=Mesorhizobium sp. CA13 TaxID=2876643 RepID=UPI001CCE0624|nr:hypothetical protein [Mesorhizobium sp. CA13]MBZ9857717.1 hypothetical protein [Mesorhizobium sp. CA13]
MLVSLELKEEDKSLGPGECKEVCFHATPDGEPPRIFLKPPAFNAANGNSASLRAAQHGHDIGKADIGTENYGSRDNGRGKKLDVGL